MKNHIKEYMIHCNNLIENIHFFNVDSTFCFDTESCFVSEEIKQMYEKKEKTKHKGDAVRVYAWALSNTTNDYVLYGETLDQFFDSIETILYSRVNLNQKMSESKVKQIRKQLKMRIFVHNLAWDIEFMKYHLLRNGYDYYNSKVKDGKKVIERHSPHSFNITENENIVYGANVNFKEKILIGKDKFSFDLASKYKFKYFKNSSSHLGQSQSVILGSKNATSDAFMFIPGDMPFLTKDTFLKVIFEFEQKDMIIVPTLNDRPSPPIIFPRRFQNELLLLSGDNGGREVLKKNKYIKIYVTQSQEFSDIDTQEDLKNI